MTVFSAIKSAVLRTTGERITEAFTSSDHVAVEMCDLVNEVADDIAKAHDWQLLTKIHTVTGDGVTEAFSLPLDYDRMVIVSDVDDPVSWFCGYTPFANINEWMRYKNGALGLVAPGGWIILGGQMQFYPAPSDSAQFPYVSNLWGLDDGGDPIGKFTRDDDSFVLSEKLLRLGLIWRWRDQKNMDYGEDMANYERELSLLQGRDRGSRPIRQNASHAFSGARFGWPWELG